MCDHPSTKFFTSGGNVRSCLPSWQPLVIRRSPQRVCSPMDRPGPRWSCWSPAALPLRAACWWPWQRPLLSIFYWGQCNTPRHATASVPSPAVIWRRSGCGGRLPPKKSTPPRVRRPRRCYGAWSSPPSSWSDICSTLSRKFPPWPLYPVGNQGWNSPETSLSEQTTVPCSNRCGCYTSRIKSSDPTPFCIPSPFP